MSEEQSKITKFGQSGSSSDENRKMVQMGPKSINIPSSWVLTPCGDMYDPINGRAFSKEEWSDKGTPIIRIQDLREDADSEINYYEGDVDTKYHVDDGDLLFSWAGNIETSLGAYIWDGGSGYLNQHIYNLKKKEDVNNLFIKYSLNHYLPILKTMVSGSAGQVHITKTNFNRFEIPIPPIEEQRDIATVLHMVDKVIQKTSEIIGQIKRVKQGLYQDLFRDWSERTKFEALVGDYPKNWELVKLSDVVDVIDAEHFTPDYVESGIPVLRPGDLKPGRINLADVEKEVDEETYQKLINRYVPTNSEIVYSRSQNFAVASKVVENQKYCIGQDMVVINTKEINAEFLLYLLNSPIVKKQAIRKSTGTTFSRVNLGDIRSYKIPVPDKETQDEIASVMSGVEDRLIIEQNYRENLKRLKQGLMQDLLSGTVRTRHKDIETVPEIKTFG